MPLNQNQINTINTLINGTPDNHDHSLNGYVNAIINAREDVLALLRIHADIDNSTCNTIITNARARADAAAQALVTLL